LGLMLWSHLCWEDIPGVLLITSKQIYAFSPLNFHSTLNWPRFLVLIIL
jgi:hypothetical protein